MTFIMNKTSQAIGSYVQATVASHTHLEKHPDLPLVYLKERNPHTIPILSGGGSGHEPAHIGYVGQGMLTAAIYGPIFCPPAATDILKAIQFLDQGKGVFLIIKNFEADLTQFSQAIHQARNLGHTVKYVLSHDDISIEPKSHFQIRGRGLAGTILLHKAIGFAAQKGASLEELESLGFDLAPNIATIGFATRSASLPQASRPLFALAADSISYGIGIHGEEGYRVVPFQSSELLANEIVNKLRLHFHWKKGESYTLLVNNLGTATDLEMGVFLHDIVQLLDIEGLQLQFVKSGRFMTSLDMTGISVTLCHSQEILSALQSPTDAFAW